MNYLGNQLEFEKMFTTEQDCIDYLTLIRWPDSLYGMRFDQPLEIDKRTV